MARKIAYAIARESSGDKTLENQFAGIRKAAKELGYEIVQEFGENISGNIAKYDYANPKFIEDLDIAIKRKKPDAIFCVSMDRITRTPVMQGKYLMDFSVLPQIPIYFTRYKRWTIDPATKSVDIDWIDDLATEKGSKTERLNIIARTKPQRETNGLEGYYIGHLSDGYCVEESWGTYEDGHRRKIKKIVIDEDRRKVIEDIYKYYINGYSTDKIANLLNADNVPTTNKYRAEHHDKFGHRKNYVGRDRMIRDRTKATWNGSLVSAILANEWYKGVRHYKGTPQHHDPIISPEEWEEVASIRNERKKKFRNNKEASKHIYLLSNLIFCSKCGSKLYGHYTGLNNHYYCPSAEKSNPCGLKGICKENVEAIINNVIMVNAIRSIAKNEHDITADFFTIDKTRKQRITDEIENNNKIIINLRADIEDINNAIYFYLRQQEEHKDNKDRVRRLDTIILAKEKELVEKTDTIKKLLAENKANKGKLSIGTDVKDIVRNIMGKKELSLIKQLFKQTIEKVTLFNTEKTNDIVRILYKNGKVNEIIYSSGLMKGGYILLVPPLHYDEVDNLIISSKYPVYVYIINGKNVYVKERKYEKVNELFPGLEVTHIECYEFNRGFTVDEFIHLVRTTTLVFSYERLEEEPEIAKEKREYQQQWRKKYNTGRPKGEQYVLHNETYEEIQLKRNRLYRKSYKIKHRKTLSVEKKTELLAEIKRQLDILTVQVPLIKPRKKRKSSKTDDNELLRIVTEPLE